MRVLTNRYDLQFKPGTIIARPPQGGERVDCGTAVGVTASGEHLEVVDENISPREGIRVTRSYQFTRWHDGSTHLWLGRRKRVGSGEGLSGFRFDTRS